MLEKSFVAHDGRFYLHWYLRTVYILKMNLFMPNLISLKPKQFIAKSASEVFIYDELIMNGI